MDDIEETGTKHAFADAVLRKIGRNVLLFQQIEGLLKFLVANHRVVTTASGCLARQNKQAEKIHKQVMGKPVAEYADGILSDAGEPTVSSEDLPQVKICTTFKISAEGDFFETQRAAMNRVVDERNELIHHFLPRWRPDSAELMSAAATYLDEQHESVLPMFEHLRETAKSIQECHQLLADFLASEEAQRQFELIWLQNSPLVALLCEVATEQFRPDGWTYLAHAGQIARLREPDAVAHMEERYGHATLKRLLIASELFDVWDEPLSNGRFQTLYRIKEALEN